MQILVTEIDDADHAKLDAFLKQSGNSLLYYSPSYLLLLKNYLKCTIAVVTIEQNNRMVAYLPLAIKTGALGSICNSLPFYGSNGSMVVAPSLSDAEKQDCYRLLLDEAGKIVREHNCIASTFITNPLDPGVNEYFKENFEHSFVDERIGQITELPPGSDDENILMALFDDPRPRNIRKAIKSGILVHADSIVNQKDFLYQTHTANILAIGGIPKEKEFFDRIADHFSEENCKVYIASLNGAPVAALLLFYYNKTVEYFTPVVVDEFRSMQPTALIIFKAMQDAANAGYNKWNWGGTWLSQGGVYDFKKKWGAKDYHYFYYTRLYNEDVRNYSKSDLLEQYPNFFVLPFNQVSSTDIPAATAS